jgi:hypothetical protein
VQAQEGGAAVWRDGQRHRDPGMRRRVREEQKGRSVRAAK